MNGKKNKYKTNEHTRIDAYHHFKIGLYCECMYVYKIYVDAILLWVNFKIFIASYFSFVRLNIAFGPI